MMRSKKNRLASQTDAELVDRARAARPGDTQAFDELVTRHQGSVMANCRYLTRSPADIEDLTQDVFVKAYFALGRFEGRAQFGTWVRRIKINHCLNFIEKRRGKRFVDIDDSEAPVPEGLREERTADGEIERKQMRGQIDDILDGMPESLRVPLVMRELDQLSYQEIADTLGLGLSAVKMRIKRGREHFRAQYSEPVR